MDSPVRQLQKRNDYLRHKMFRKINRRRRAKRQLEIEAPVKELKKRLRLKRTFEDGKDGEELPYPLRTSRDYDDNLAYQSGLTRDPKTGHMMSTTQEEYPKERTYLKTPSHPTYSLAVWGDKLGGYDVYNRNGKTYSAPTFSELMYTKPPFKYAGGKDGEELVKLPEVRVDSEGNVIADDGRRGTVRLSDVVAYADPDSVAKYRKSQWDKDFEGFGDPSRNSAYHPEDVEQAFNLTGVGMLFNPFRLARTSNQFLQQPTFNNAVEIAHDALPWSKAGRFLLGAYGLGNEEGLAKTYDLIREGKYGRAALSGLGDILNAAMAIEGGSGTFNRLRNILSPKVEAPFNLPGRVDAGLSQVDVQPEVPVNLLDGLKSPRKPYVAPSIIDRGPAMSYEEIMSLPTGRLKQTKSKYNKPSIDVSSKDFNDIVREDGTVDVKAFKRAIDIYSKLNNTPHKFDDVVGADKISKHTFDVARTAQDSPVPVGSTKKEQMGAALLHDLGKLYGYNNHGENGADIVLYPREQNQFNAAITNVPPRIRSVIADHMSTETHGSKDNLLRATQFADVARGLPYEEAAIKFPHLLYERQGIKQPQYPKIPLREEIRDYINPWLKDNGYGPYEDVVIEPTQYAKTKNGIPPRVIKPGTTKRKYTGIPLDATEEEAWAIVEDAVKQHRRVLRGARLSSGSNHMSKETQELLEKVREEDLAKTIKDRPITDEDRLIWEVEHINGTPTGYGRLNIFDAHQPRYGLSYNTLGNNSSKYYKIDPNRYDAKYTSLSDDVSDTYARTDNDRPSILSVLQLAGGVERTPEMSMREYIARNDWDLYSGSAKNPIGIYNMLIAPFRLLTGKSLTYLSSKGLYPEKGKIPRIEKPKIDSSISDIHSDGMSFANFHEFMLKNILYNRLDAEIKSINDFIQSHGYKPLDIKKGKNGEIYYPQLISVLNERLENIDRSASTLNNLMTSRWEKTFDYIESNMHNIDKDIKLFRSFAYPYPGARYIAPELEIAGDIQLEMLSILNEFELHNVFSEKELDILNKLCQAGKISEIYKYLEKNNIFSDEGLKKKMYSTIRNMYFDGILRERKNADKYDIDSYLKKVNDPKRLISIMRQYGAVPRHEMPGFNNTMAIQTAGGTRTKGGSINTDGQYRNELMGIIGKFGERVLEAEENMIDKPSKYTGRGKGSRDMGRRSDKKLTKKTLASILALITGGALLKSRSKRSEKNTRNEPRNK